MCRPLCIVMSLLKPSSPLDIITHSITTLLVYLDPWSNLLIFLVSQIHIFLPTQATQATQAIQAILVELLKSRTSRDKWMMILIKFMYQILMSHGMFGSCCRIYWSRMDTWCWLKCGLYNVSWSSNVWYDDERKENTCVKIHSFN